MLVLAPNWLGDAVMALPAIADIRRAFPSARLVVAARRAVADLFRLVPFVDEIVTLQWSGRWWQRDALSRPMPRGCAHWAPTWRSCCRTPSPPRGSSKRAAIPDRWGYASDMRAPLLSRAVPRPKGSLHQGAYYQHLTRALGFDERPAGAGADGDRCGGRGRARAAARARLGAAQAAGRLRAGRGVRHREALDAAVRRSRGHRSRSRSARRPACWWEAAATPTTRDES